MEAAIQAPGPSFRDMQFCAGGGYFFGRLSDGFEASFCKFQKAALGSGGGHPSTRSVLQGRLYNHPAGGAWVHARTMANMKLPIASTRPVLIVSARHNVVTEGACVFVDGHCLGCVTGLQNRHGGRHGAEGAEDT